MKKALCIVCGLLFSFAAGFGAYAALSRDALHSKPSPDARTAQAAKEAQYVKERDAEYRMLLERGTKELYEQSDAGEARKTFTHALDIALDDAQRYQAWRWLGESVRDADADCLRRAGQQMTSLGGTERERAEGLFVTAEAQEKLGALRESVRLYEAAAVSYQKAGDPAAGCAAFQRAADAALLPGLADIKLCRRMLHAEEALLQRVPGGAERDRLLYDFTLSQADILRREGRTDEAQMKALESKGISP